MARVGMAFLGGLIGKLVGAAILLVVLVGAVAIFAFATDYGVEANVKEKKCASNPPQVQVVTKLFAISKTVDVTHDQCSLIQPGSFVVYHLRTAHTIIYARDGGPCIYDSKAGACTNPN